MAPAKQKKSKSDDKDNNSSGLNLPVVRMVDLRRGFIIFSLIYFPVVWLFTGRGLLEEVILAVYGVALTVVGILLIISFVGRLAYDADEHNGAYGGLFASYLVNAFYPLVIFKFIAFSLLRILPETHSDKVVCDLICLSRSLYFQLYQVQDALNIIILGSLVLMFTFTLWSVGRKD